jgi:hypothetical protein
MILIYNYFITKKSVKVIKIIKKMIGFVVNVKIIIIHLELFVIDVKNKEILNEFEIN